MLLNPHRYSKDFNIQEIYKPKEFGILYYKRNIFIIDKNLEFIDSNSIFNSARPVDVILTNISKVILKDFNYVKYKESCYTFTGFFYEDIKREFNEKNFSLVSMSSTEYARYDNKAIDIGISVALGFNDKLGPYSVNLNDLFCDGLDDTDSVDLISPLYYDMKQAEEYDGDEFANMIAAGLPAFQGSQFIDEQTEVSMLTENKQRLKCTKNKKILNDPESIALLWEKSSIVDSIFIDLFCIVASSFINSFILHWDSDYGYRIQINKKTLNKYILIKEKVKLFVEIIKEKLEYVCKNIERTFGKIAIKYYHGPIYDVLEVYFIEDDESICIIEYKKDLIERAIVSRNKDDYVDLMAEFFKRSSYYNY